MLTEKDLHDLLELQTLHPILSVYLNTDPTAGSADVHKLNLRSLLKDVDLRDDAYAIERYFDHEYNWSGWSVAVFSCVPENFLKAYPNSNYAPIVRDRLARL